MKTKLKNGKYSINIILFFFLMVIIGTGGCSQSKDDNSAGVNTANDSISKYLCVADYLTPEQGAELLKKAATTYNDAEGWSKRAKIIRDGIVKGSEIKQIPDADWEMPMNVIISNKHVMDGYTVENIALEAKPGYFITGNLYKPLHVKGKIPAILNPHGHWFMADNYGRFRPDMQRRCAAFAKMGAVAFAYDMVGYGECHGYRHTGKKALQYQIYNGMRILDYLSSLDYVDTTRIGMTGASGGGTQTILVSAVDNRVDVSAPVVMVSSYFFGGCVCESGMPIHKDENHETNNVEIAAVIAPKPLLLVSDGDDWTSTMPEIGFPYIENVYKLFNAGDKTNLVHFPNEVHNYGLSKRKAVYPFMAKYLDLDYNKILDKDGNVDESSIELLPIEYLKVFPEEPLEFLCDYNKYSPYAE